MRKLGTLFFATVLTALALVPVRAGAWGYFVCDADCECSWACRNGADGTIGYSVACEGESGGCACYC